MCGRESFPVRRKVMSENNLVIREALDSDLDTVMHVESAAFGFDKEAHLVRDLLGDPTAKPLISLLAFEGKAAVGHILFTKVTLQPEAPLSLSILAPLAVIPDAQNKGIGGKLIEHGLGMLSESSVDLVFVLGHPGYYPRHGFIPGAGALGFDAPYPIPEKHWNAWMVQELRPDVIGSYRGKVICAETLDKPEHWRE